MLKICPECLNVNSNVSDCISCGYPLNKKGVGRMEDYYLFDIIELVNNGQLVNARKKLEEKTSTLNDHRLDILKDKINILEEQMARAEEHASSAFKSFQQFDLEIADREIKAARAICDEPKFRDLENRIQSARKDQQAKMEAKDNWGEGMRLVKIGQAKQGIVYLKAATQADPENLDYTSAFKKELDSHTEFSISAVNNFISQGNLSAANDEIKELMSLNGTDLRVQNLNMEVAELINRKRKKKSTATWIIAVVILIAIGSGIFILVSRSNEKKKWNLALQKGSITSIQEYIANNSNSSFLSEAETKLSELLRLDSLEWDKVIQSGQRTAATAYIDLMNTIEGRHLAEAKDLIDSLDWKQIEKSENSQDFSDYLSKHPSGRYADLARGKVALQVSEYDRNQLFQYITSYFESYNSKDLEAVMSYYDPITAVFGSKRNITKADLRLLFENDLKNILSSTTTLDAASFKVKKDPDNNLFITFYSDTYITKSTMPSGVEADPNSEDAVGTSINYFTNSEWNLVLNENRKISSYNYRIISQQEINK